MEISVFLQAAAVSDISGDPGSQLRYQAFSPYGSLKGPFFFRFEMLSDMIVVFARFLISSPSLIKAPSLMGSKLFIGF